ncbi:ThiF family adenylyltransferase [Georgenia sp. AZ-5]|uniref:ThiF family adenylyltransferase n=1 Tax=Georgenia sp. AZ-5 TaxID=3367526 RepID=UPI00375402DB
MRLRPGLVVLWRREGESQIGADPRCAVVLEDLTPGEQRVLDHLRHAPTEADLVRVGRTAGVGADRVRELVTLLTRSGVLAPEPGRGASPTPRTPEEAYWARLRPDADGAAVSSARAAAVVAVLGLDRLGVNLATFLATAGVGTLLLADPTTVTESDLGPYHPRDVGRRRREQAVAQLRSTFPRLRTAAAPGTRPDVVVAVSTAVADPVRLRPLVRDDVVHMPVVVGEVDVAVGPLVVPGRGPCTRCVDLHRTDADPCWPAVATQLRAEAPTGTEATVSQLGAALAAHQVLAWLDGREVAVLGATLEVGAADPLPVVRRWSVHPECGCTDLETREPPVAEAALAT